MSENGGFTYKDSGVDVEAGNLAVKLLKERLKSTQNPLVVSGIGGFGGVMRMPPVKDAVLVAGADGAGTKTMIAREMGIYDTVGIDAVAMNVNDISACGAHPLFFLDYLVVAKIVPERVATIVARRRRGLPAGRVRAARRRDRRASGPLRPPRRLRPRRVRRRLRRARPALGAREGEAPATSWSASPRAACTPTASASCASVLAQREVDLHEPFPGSADAGAGDDVAGKSIGEVDPHADGDLQPRAARLRPRLRGARGGAHHRRRLSRQRRAAAAAGARRRARPRRLDAAAASSPGCARPASPTTTCSTRSTAASAWSSSMPADETLKALDFAKQHGHEAWVVGEVVARGDGDAVRYRGSLWS